MPDGPVTRLAIWGNIALVVVVALLLWRLDHVSADRDEAINALNLQVAEYRMQAERAVAEQAAAARAIEQQQQDIGHEVSQDYQQRLAAVRARYERLLAAAKANPGGASEGDMPGFSYTPSGPDAEPAYCGLPAERALIATEQAVQLSALQAWVRGQAALNREPAR